MPVYDVTLNGFDGEGDTDHLVKWVKAKSELVLREWLRFHGLLEHVQSIDELENPNELTFEDGVDVEVVDVTEQISNGTFKPSKWIEEATT